MLTVLMIDDEEDLVTTVQSYIESEFSEVQFESKADWTKAASRIGSVRPDLVILDWFGGSAGSGDIAGKKVLDEIWMKWFCPVLVYSAGSVDLEEEVPSDHPFVKTVEKGDKSSVDVSGHLREFSPHVRLPQERHRTLEIIPSAGTPHRLQSHQENGEQTP
jgi:hypothetical protein